MTSSDFYPPLTATHNLLDSLQKNLEWMLFNGFGISQENPVMSQHLIQHGLHLCSPLHPHAWLTDSSLLCCLWWPMHHPCLLLYYLSYMMMHTPFTSLQLWHPWRNGWAFCLESHKIRVSGRPCCSLKSLQEGTLPCSCRAGNISVFRGLTSAFPGWLLFLAMGPSPSANLQSHTKSSLLLGALWLPLLPPK